MSVLCSDSGRLSRTIRPTPARTQVEHWFFIGLGIGVDNGTACRYAPHVRVSSKLRRKRQNIFPQFISLTMCSLAMVRHSYAEQRVRQAVSFHPKSGFPCRPKLIKRPWFVGSWPRQTFTHSEALCTEAPPLPCFASGRDRGSKLLPHPLLVRCESPPSYDVMLNHHTLPKEVCHSSACATENNVSDLQIACKVRTSCCRQVLASQSVI